MNVNAKQVASMQHSGIEEGAGLTTVMPQTSSRMPEINEDDRYPGSFFRIPGVPAPGKTTWSLTK